MKKFFLSTLVLMMSVVLFADVVSVDGYKSDVGFYQFVPSDFHSADSASQDWLAARQISLHVGSSMDVWLSNYISSWYMDIPALNQNEFNMGSGKYGAYDVNTGKVYVGTGETSTVTYAAANGAGKPNSTEAYYLGHFNGGEDLVLWMTSLDADGGETDSSTQLVNNGEFDPTTLVSRVNGTYDQAGNIRLNFGYNSDTIGYVGREFVAFGSYGNFGGSDAPSGQPLPGVFTSLLITGGLYGLIRKRKKE